MNKALVEYPFRLRSDLFVFIRLPSDFDREDFKRLAAWLPHLVVEHEQTTPSASIPAGAQE